MGSIFDLRSTAGNRRHAGGFTLIELVTVMVLTGIIATIAIPRLIDKLTFNTRGFADQSRAGLQYAQKVAIAQRRNVCVAVASGSITVTKAAAGGSAVACSAAVLDPVSGAAYTLTAPSGVSIGASSTPITFDALGSVSTGATVTLTGDQAISITVEAATGYVH